MVNEFLAQIEEKRGDLSYRRLAKQAGLSHGHVANVLRGKAKLSFETVKIMADWAGLNRVKALEMAGLLPAGAVGHE
jgi:transcriptional regulator with XRE-family HTH domain